MISLLALCGHGGWMPLPGFPGPRTRPDGAGRGGPLRADPVRPDGREPQSMDAHLCPPVKSGPEALDPACPAITESRDLTPRAERSVDAAPSSVR